VTLDSIQERYERELANDLGNLVSRTTAMIARYRDGKLTKTEAAPPWDVDELRTQLVAQLDQFDITNALESIWTIVRRLNQYVEESAPWQLAKDDARAGELDEVLYNLADGITSVAVALSPYLPENAPAILAALGQPSDDLSLERIRPKSAVDAEGIEPAAPLFPRVDLPTAAA
jgi:methionyl-tRNA synthetase